MWLSLNLHLQTELAINTHLTVANTHTIVSDIHRNMLKGEEGTSSKRQSVSVAFTPSIVE